jgi:hypothetical protein
MTEQLREIAIRCTIDTNKASFVGNFADPAEFIEWWNAYADVHGSPIEGRMTPPPVSETAAWTEQDERTVEHYATRWELRDDILSGITMTTASRICREILRLRAENERLTKDLSDAAGELLIEMPEPGSVMSKLLSANILLRRENDRLRSELAATRERETPPEIPDEVSFELWDSEGCFATGFDTPIAADDVKALYLHRRADSFLVRSTTSRSRVSDNGK